MNIKFRRTSDFRTYDSHNGGNGQHNAKIKPPESLVLSKSRHSQYHGLYSTSCLGDKPIEGAGEATARPRRPCPECGRPFGANRCRGCGYERARVHADARRDTADVPADSGGVV